MKKIKFYLILWCSILLASESLMAQQEVMYTQYMFNGLALNPAYAGSHKSLSMTALHRQQWVGFGEGAPQVSTFSAHSPINNRKISLGFIFVHDEIGLAKTDNLNLSYAYRLQTGEKGYLSFGVQAGFSGINGLYDQVNQINKTDDAAFIDIEGGFLPNFGFGTYYFNDRFYAGFSLPHMLNNVITNNENFQTKQIRHMFFTTGYVFDLNEDLKLKPNLLFKGVEGAPIQMDLNVNLLMREVLWVGLSYRSLDSFSGILELLLTDQLRLGYSYDFANTTDLRTVQSGSHEIMLNYTFTFSKSKIISPRYF